MLRRWGAAFVLVCPAALLIVADAWRWRWFTHPDLRLARDAAEVLWSPQGLQLSR